jgi:hypothetical protein
MEGPGGRRSLVVNGVEPEKGMIWSDLLKYRDIPDDLVYISDNLNALIQGNSAT